MKRFVLIILTVLFLVACVEEMDYIQPGSVTGEEIQVELNWSVAGMVAGDEMTKVTSAERQYSYSTRVIPSDMEADGIYNDNYPTIQNIWIIQFDGNTPAAKMLGAPRFLSVEDGDLGLSNPLNESYPITISVPLVKVPEPCYTLFVANIRQGGNYSWNLTAESTFADVITRVKTIQGESGAFEDFTSLGAFPEGSKTLLMSAVTITPVEYGTPLEPVFKRNVAKVTLKLKLDNAEMSIASVRMRNVSNSIVFADAALSHNYVTAATIFPVDATVIDYNPITDESKMPISGETATFSWYIPRNQQGVNSRSTSHKQKTFFAPANATYIEIVAVKGASTSIFRVYPGADMTKDFNLTTNHEYTVGLNVVDIGTDPTDSRVQIFKNLIDYSGPPNSMSNTFIINPAPAIGGGDRTYLIGIHQVNRFWGSSAPGYGKNPLYTISEGETWVVDLIWSDLPGLFSTSPSTTAISLLDYYNTVAGGGTGPNQAFALNVPPNLPAGNFVLGIKKVNGDKSYLWSWHFWVTDYAPDNFNRALIDNNIYTYVVPGGQVERYAPGITGTNNDLLWTSTGFYANSVMMDRNIGAVENFFTTTFSTTSRGMFHYQFGRKDPIPGNISFTIGPNSGFVPSGTGLPNAEGPVSIAESVNYPFAFYNSTDNWTNVADGAYIWNDPNVPNFAAGKSIYDPCPPGWKVPLSGTWNDFARTVDGNFVTILNLGRDLGWLHGRGIGTADATVNGIRYWPGTTINEPASGKIWYPAMGSRNGSNAAFNNTVGSANYWSATQLNTTQATYLNTGNSAVTVQRSAVRANAYAVRCIADSQ